MKQAPISWKLIAVLALGALLGCFAERLCATPRAAAQDRSQFRECMAVTLHSHDGAAFANPRWQPVTIRIRPGWTVVGGSGGNRAHAVVCR